jgi:hypothetical protein
MQTPECAALVPGLQNNLLNFDPSLKGSTGHEKETGSRKKIRRTTGA